MLSNPFGLGLIWNRLGTDLPDVLGYDLAYTPGSQILTLATLGRGVWSLSF
jgi:hypothetical protein